MNTPPLIKTIKDSTYQDGLEWRTRQAARAIVLDTNGLMPFIFVSGDNYYKLPGGGIDEGETIMQALQRELLEEAGCDVEIDGEVGTVIEYRTEYNIKQTSYCYYGRVVGQGNQNLDQYEKDLGFELQWVTPKQAIERIKSSTPYTYQGPLIVERDLALLQKFVTLHSNES